MLGLMTAALLASSALAHPASPLAVAVVKAQFQQSLLTQDVPGLADFDPIGTIIVNYTGLPVINNGVDVTAASLASAPVLKIKGTEAAEASVGAPFDNSTRSEQRYAVLMFDAQQPGAVGSLQNRHYLATGFSRGENNDHTISLLNDSVTVLTPYAAPGPSPGSGPHRYVWALFAHPTEWTPPTVNGTGVQPFNYTEFVATANMSKPIAAVYMQVQNNASALSVSVAPTQPVQSSTLAQFTPTSTGPTTATLGQSSSTSARPGSGGGAAQLKVGVLLVALSFACAAYLA